ncbi:MAG: T9SS type A sorting domain-containing protein [Bacteroidetes bacterium]|nr:T9SS type A sorting domain-containing protein [Bacteroidota bacterium]
MRRSLSATAIAALCGWLILTGAAQALMDTAWVRSYTPLAPYQVMAAGIDSDGNCYTAFQGWDGVRDCCAAMKYDSGGNFQWNYLSPQGIIIDAEIDRAGNTYMTGTKWDMSESLGMLVKLNSSGVPVISQVWNGYGGRTVVYNSSGDCFVADSYFNPNGYVDDSIRWHGYDSDIAVRGFSALGSELFSVILNYLYDDWPECLAISPDGNLYLSGYHSNSPWVTHNRNARLYKLAADGSLTWMREFDYGENGYDDLTVVAADYQSNAIMAVRPESGAKINKLHGAGGLLWGRDASMWIRELLVDDSGAIITARGSQIEKYNSSGTSLWTVDILPAIDTALVWCTVTDVKLYGYDVITTGSYGDFSREGHFTARVDSLGDLTWIEEFDVAEGRISDMYSEAAVDDSGSVFVSFIDHTGGWPYTMISIKYVEGTKHLTIRDARRDSIPDIEFNLIKVSNNPPYFDEDTLGSFTTDSEGRLSLTPIGPDSFFVQLDLTGDTLVVGDSLKIAKHVHSVPAVKHQALLGTMHSVHLDNAQFAEDGHMFFDTLTSRNQNIVLNHTELRYNLLVSVEWEATEYYLRDLEDNFARMSNYLYDVTDGQARLDTVLIYDARDQWHEADMRICADNTIRPYCDKGVAGMLRSATDGYQIYMPRIWWYNGDGTRNHTGGIYPLDLTTESVDYRTKAHEFGHYALGFYDEYRLFDPSTNSYVEDDATLRCLPTSIFHYGFMDSQYEISGGVMSSEMSNAFRYDLSSCRNTEQWGTLNSSCWDHFERWVEAVPWGPDNLFVPILKPDATDSTEHLVTNPAVYFPGPNNDVTNLDYDVGIMIHSPNTPSAQIAGYSNKHVTVHHSTGGDNAKIQLWNNPHAGPPSEIVISQGNSSDASGAWVLGVKDAAYQIMASKGNSLGTVTLSPALASPQQVTTGWLYGMAESGGSGVSKVGNSYSANSAEDSITIELNEVQGYYPLISKAMLTADGAMYDITATQSFPSEPTLELWPSYGGSYSQSVSLSGSGYSATVSDSLGESGSFMIWASDDSLRTFFVPNRYVITGGDHERPFIWLFGAEGQSEFRLDSANVSLTKALILSSPYPVIRTGLDENAVRAGQTHCLSVYPDNPITGSNQVVIRYDDADLRLGDQYLGDEATLAAYQWVDNATGWQIIGGSVDTADNVIYAPITQSGVFAAFTYDIITDVEDDDHGELLPYLFELSQNYPNPFNPVTTIEYSLPERSQVTIEVYNVLGQKVRTLVDREESAGSYTITWDGTSSTGETVSTGVYFYRFQADDHVETKKMLLLK